MQVYLEFGFQERNEETETKREEVLAIAWHLHTYWQDLKKNAQCEPFRDGNYGKIICNFAKSVIWPLKVSTAIIPILPIPS